MWEQYNIYRHESKILSLTFTPERPPSPLAHSEGGQCDRTVFPGCLTVSGLYNKWPCSRSQTPHLTVLQWRSNYEIGQNSTPIEDYGG